MKKDVLLVEDYRPTSHMLQTLLELKGYKVRLALDGLEALQQIEVKIPGVILLDLKMPSMDGYAFLDALERQEEGTSIPVLVITADSFAGPELAHRRVKIFYKPLCFGPLLATLEQFCKPEQKENPRNRLQTALAT